KSDEEQFGAVALARPRRARKVFGRAIAHRPRCVAPQPDALRRLPFGLAHIQALRFRALTPIDAGRRAAGLILAELPARFAPAHPAATVDAWRHSGGAALGGDEQRRQRRGGLLGAMPQRHWWRPPARQRIPG